jgi:hypothetical protein
MLEWATFLIIKNTIDKKRSLNNEKLDVLMRCGLLELLVITYIVFSIEFDAVIRMKFRSKNKRK